MPDSVIVFIVVIVYLMIVIDIAIILYFIYGSINKKTCVSRKFEVETVSKSSCNLPRDYLSWFPSFDIAQSYVCSVVSNLLTFHYHFNMLAIQFVTSTYLFKIDSTWNDRIKQQPPLVAPQYNNIYIYIFLFLSIFFC